MGCLNKSQKDGTVTRIGTGKSRAMAERVGHSLVERGDKHCLALTAGSLLHN